MIELVIPRGIRSQNEFVGRHWAEKHRDRDDWGWLVKVAIRAMTPEPPKADGPRALTIIANKQRAIDLPNIIGGAKGLIDALVASGQLKDDSPAWLCELNVREVIDRTAPEKTVIQLIIL